MLIRLSRNPRRRLLMAATAAAISVLVAVKITAAYQYKVGDLDAWGVPPPSNRELYSSWALNHHLLLGDSLLFLYPPSQDSVIQVTDLAFNACTLADPILKMDDGNSVFNLTSSGTFYFTSGVAGRCQKGQRLQIAVPDANRTFFPLSSGPAGPAPAAAGPSAYPLVFGPTTSEGSDAPPPSRIPAAVVAGSSVVGAILCFLL